MALIRCPECSAEISDRAKCCPKCGAPVAVHKWRCAKCGNTISETPCPYCGGEGNLPKYYHISSNANSSGAKSVSAKQRKRNAGYTLLAVAITLAAVLLCCIAIGNGGKSNHQTNPHDNCHYVGKDREYFAGPMVDVYFNYDHPEWGYHTHE